MQLAAVRLLLARAGGGQLFQPGSAAGGVLPFAANRCFSSHDAAVSGPKQQQCVQGLYPAAQQQQKQHVSDAQQPRHPQGTALQQPQQQLLCSRGIHSLGSSSSSSSSSSSMAGRHHHQQRSVSTQSGAGGEEPAAAETAALSTQLGQQETLRQLDELLQVLLHPMPRAARWNAQLSPYLLQVNDQLLLQPRAVLLSVVRALHVIRGVLQENGQVYVVENNQLLRPLIKTAALSCINPNVWFDHRTWSPGTLTNYASSKRLFKESHQPNRRLFAAKGYSMVNPLLPRDDSGRMAPPPLQAPVPRLSYDDKWLLLRRTRRPGFSQLLQELLASEDALHRFKPAGSLKGVPQDLQLMIFLDSTKNAVAIKEAYNRNIPTIAIVNASSDMSTVTYPVLARDFSPAFVHFFLDWVLKVANTPLPKSQPAGAGKKSRPLPPTQ